MKSRISVMISIVLAVLVSSLDATIMNTTAPHIVSELGGFHLYAWSFVSYMIASTVLTPIAGRLSDLFGRKKVFAAGMIVFLLGSILCGSAQTMLQLVLFRIVQGCGAGMMMPFPAIIAGDLFAVEKRGRIQAMFSAMWGISAVIAPLLGAVFVAYASWRWIFYVNIPVCLLAIVLLIPYKEVYEAKRAPIDLWGAALFTGSVSLLLLLTIVNSGYVWYAIGGIVLFVLFFYFEKQHRSPLIPFQLFRNRNVGWMVANSFLSCCALFGTSTFIPLFLQEAKNYGIFMSGLPLLGEAAGWMLVSVPAGRWIIKYGYRNLLIIGNVLLVLCGILLIMMNEGSSFWYVFSLMFVEGLAYGLIFTVTTIGAQQLVGPHEKGISTSIQFFARNIGTAVGTTLMGAFLTKAVTTMIGIHHLFLFGFWMTLASVVTAFFIRATEADRKSVQAN